MIDKYKRPRVQRMPTWRGPAPNAGVLTLELLQRIVRKLRMQQPAAQEALVSGAMPSEFDPKDLRSL